MNVTVVGTGYVGLVTGTCFAEMGNTVICVDIDKEKIDKLNKSIIPIYEPGLKELISSNSHKTLFFSTNLEEAIGKSDIIFIAVGTPMSKDGSADLSAVFNVATSIGKVILEHKIVVSKSTVPVGTTLRVKEIIQEQINKRGVHVDFDVVSNPEFLKEGAAINDFMKPDRIVIGAEKKEVFSKMKQLYSSFFRASDRFIVMDIHSAEMTKYAANAMLATKISFINEMANICEKVGADVNSVRVGIGSDSRIGYDFIYPGIGYGGTCFPKDISALIKLGKDNGYNPAIISSVNELNKKQKEYFFDKIVKRFKGNLKGLTFGVWGLSFKPETDDMREAASVYIINKLLEKGALVKAYDPKAMKTAKKHYFKNNEIVFAQSKMDAIQDVDALLLLTEWKEFRLIDFDELKKQMKQAIIFDGRNQYRTFELEKKEFEYYQIGKV
tara:strand:- start:749 stop:2068 length:1320 start_codon:yes stop_codon:yes gene_type:complete